MASDALKLKQGIISHGPRTIGAGNDDDSARSIQIFDKDVGAGNEHRTPDENTVAIILTNTHAANTAYIGLDSKVKRTDFFARIPPGQVFSENFCYSH